MTKFCRYDLRTTDADAARAFYTQVLGHDRARIWPLHEQAIARGARPHWLGRLGVENVERVAAAFVARGATRLGPAVATTEGEFVVLRDAGGAVVSVGAPPPDADARVDVVWQVLNTNDSEQAAATYCELFAWELTDRIDLGAEGSFQQFTWDAGGASVGAIADIAARPGVHPHWIFFFEVDALDVAIATVRAAGGLALDPFSLPSGGRGCACDDAQGAAFGLRERRRAKMGATSGDTSARRACSFGLLES